MTTYNIDSADGNELSAGIQGEDQARQAAQRHADRLADSVFLYVPGDEDDAEEIEPSGEGYSAVADDPRVAEVAPFKARDVSITLTLPGGTEVTADCTMWLGKDSNGVETYGPCGSPLDGWMGSNLVTAVRKMHDKARVAAIDAVLAAAVNACNG